MIVRKGCRSCGVTLAEAPARGAAQRGGQQGGRSPIAGGRVISSSPIRPTAFGSIRVAHAREYEILISPRFIKLGLEKSK